MNVLTISKRAERQSKSMQAWETEELARIVSRQPANEAPWFPCGNRSIYEMQKGEDGATWIRYADPNIFGHGWWIERNESGQFRWREMMLSFDGQVRKPIVTGALTYVKPAILQLQDMFGSRTIGIQTDRSEKSTTDTCWGLLNRPYDDKVACCIVMESGRKINFLPTAITETHAEGRALNSKEIWRFELLSC